MIKIMNENKNLEKQAKKKEMKEVKKMILEFRKKHPGKVMIK